MAAWRDALTGKPRPRDRRFGQLGGGSLGGSESLGGEHVGQQHLVRDFSGVKPGLTKR